MVIHSQTAFAAPVIADWQKGPDCTHEPDSTGPPDAAGPGQPAIILGAEPIPTQVLEELPSLVATMECVGDQP